MLGVLARKGSNAQRRDGDHGGRRSRRDGARDVAMNGREAYGAVDAIAGELRSLGTAAGGACCGRGRRGRRGPQDGGERLVGGRRRRGSARRSLPELRLERRGPHTDNCGRGARIEGGRRGRRCSRGSGVSGQLRGGSASRAGGPAARGRLHVLAGGRGRAQRGGGV